MLQECCCVEPTLLQAHRLFERFHRTPVQKNEAKWSPIDKTPPEGSLSDQFSRWKNQMLYHHHHHHHRGHTLHPGDAQLRKQKGQRREDSTSDSRRLKRLHASAPARVHFLLCAFTGCRLSLSSSKAACRIKAVITDETAEQRCPLG